jgi:hypothetical protein
VTAPPLPTEKEIVAVASLWRAARREVVTSFLGTSMMPTIAPGGEVVLDCGRAWNVGDIVALIDADHLIVHRIIAASPDRRWLMTRGDQRTIPDNPIEADEAVIGVITLMRKGDQWAPPRDLASQSWIRKRVFHFTVRSFNGNVMRCRRRLRTLRRLARFVRSIGVFFLRGQRRQS